MNALLDHDAAGRIKDVDVQTLPSQSGSHKIADLTIGGLTPENPEVEVPVGKVGMKRVTHLDPQPIGEPFRVAWDGNSGSVEGENPRLRFDEWPATPDGDVQVRVELWGL